MITKLVKLTLLLLLTTKLGFSSEIPSGRYLWCGTYAEYGDYILMSQRKNSIIRNIRNFTLGEFLGVRYLNTGLNYDEDDTAYPCKLKNKDTLLCEGYATWIRDDEYSEKVEQSTLKRRKYRIKLELDLSTASHLGDKWKADFEITAGGHKRTGNCSNY